jgi:hypothetical protein
MSAALYGMERVLDQAEAAIRAGMSSKLSSLQSEYADSLTLSAPDAAGENLMAACSASSSISIAAGTSDDDCPFVWPSVTNSFAVTALRDYSVTATVTASGMSGADAATVKLFWTDSAGAVISSATVRAAANGSGTSTVSAQAPYGAVAAYAGSSYAADAGGDGFIVTSSAWSLTDDGLGYYNEAVEPSAADLAKLSRPSVLLFPLMSEGEMNASRESADEHAFVVGVVVQAKSKREMSLKLYRYTRAVRELLTTSTALSCGQCEWKATDWAARDLTPDKKRYTVAAILSAFTCTTYEFAE